MRLFIIIFSLVTVNAFAGELPSQKLINHYKDAYLEEVSGLPLLHLAGTPYEMGFQYGVLAGDRIFKTVKTIDKIVDRNKDFRLIAMKIFPPLRKFIGRVFWSKFDKNAREEIKGIVAGAKSIGIKLNRYDIAFINSVIDLGGIIKPFASIVDFDPEQDKEARSAFLKILGLDWLPTNNCDSMAVWGFRTVDGKTFQTRNVDINTGLGFEDVPLVIIYKPTNKVPYVTAAYAGIIGMFTGMNAHGIGLGQVWAFSKKVSLANPWPLQIKNVMESSTSTTEAIENFRKMKRYTYGSNFVFADAKSVSRAVELNSHRFSVFKDNDSKELNAKWNNEVYAIPMENAVFRGDVAMDTKIRREQTASNGPDGDPRTASAYKNRYKGQADLIQAFADSEILIGKEEAEFISRETAMKKHSLQNAVYANTDRYMWVSYALRQENGEILPAYKSEYRFIPFREYLANLKLNKDGTLQIETDKWEPENSKKTNEYEIIKVQNGYELKIKNSHFIVDRVFNN